MQRAKTLRKKTTPTPQPGLAEGTSFGGDTVVKVTEDSLDALFAAETEATFKLPWQKLDRGSRLDRLRKFVQAYPGLSLAERASLLTAVLQAFELRQLNSKLAVDYDPTVASILSVRGLRERIAASGLKTFRIDTPAAAARTTLKRKIVEKTTAAEPSLNAAATEIAKE